ncbi:transcription factor bHLH68 [Canna indica]|uniref:Transcription factor bHLH68 n=1 Tax=Canna indica TaxID=4628 RepID=A0AAQ3KH50_9LILI|nr:transcription factor bHLH68 [Canna indica]
MNRGVFHSSNFVQQQQQMMEGRSPTWWSMHNNNMRPPPELTTFPLLPSSSSAFPHPNSNPETAAAPWQDGQDLPESWCQLLLGGIIGEEQDKYGLTPPFQTKKMENCVNQVPHDQVLLYPPAHLNDLKQELYAGSGYNLHSHETSDHEMIQQVSKSNSWSQVVLPASSPRSCVTSSFSTNMLDFSNKARHQTDNSSECNSTEAAPVFKKARVQGSSSPKSTLKVRKEKLGDRITALHQLVSPFGKTDTASVLQEAIGYIRFLQSQIEALSSPYLNTASANMRQQQPHPHPFSNESVMNKSKAAQDQGRDEEDSERKKDLRSRGLCLVPVSFTMHVGGDTGADFWAPALGGGF